jgi:hypothetical protein
VIDSDPARGQENIRRLEGILERWTNVALLERHMESERSGDPDAIKAIIALWAPGTTPTVERYET